MFFVELPNIHILRKLDLLDLQLSKKKDLLDLPICARKCHWWCPNAHALLVSVNQKAA
jgi:hypothetical protein